MAPKGKPPTKGQKQILKENVETLALYRNMILGVLGGYLVIAYFVFNEISTLDMVLVVFAAIVYFASYQFMSSMAAPKLGAGGSILSEGCDLNMEGGIAEHVKDIIILTSGSLSLSAISRYFWLLWLLAPARAFQMLWTNILSPYFFQQAAPESEEVNEKKQKKMERKMNKHR